MADHRTPQQIHDALIGVLLLIAQTGNKPILSEAMLIAGVKEEALKAHPAFGETLTCIK